MSTETTIGEKLRELRESKELPLRKVSALLDIDVAILSKMERGERKLTKDIVLKLAEIYGHNADELLVLFLSDKIMYEIQDEDLGEKALKVAEERVKYLKAIRRNDNKATHRKISARQRLLLDKQV
jgi:transcriptional regulator with XRE-family HTH domain